MRHVQALLLLVLAWLAAAVPALAQNTTGLVVATCGTVSPNFNAGNPGPFTVGTDGKLCVNASVSASITGFTPATTGTPIAVTTGGVTGTLPAGAVVVASNIGTTNNAYCKLGASSTTSDQMIAPNSWFAFTVAAATQLTCITSSSTTTVNMVGGAGLPTGAGGGGGAGGSGFSTTDEAAFTGGTSLFAGSGGFFQTTATNNALTTGQQGMFQVTANRALFSNLRNAAGTEIGVAATPLQVSLANTAANATAVKVDGSAVTQPVSLTSTTITGSVAVTNAGTFATQLTGATNNINNIAGTISLPTGASTAALQPTNAAQGSTTSGQTGPLVQCSVTTAAPTYTTAQTDPLNCDTAGNVRVNVMTATGLAQGSTTSGQTGSMIMGAVTTADPAYTTAQTAYASMDIKGHQRMVLGGGVPETNSATGTTGATTATLATAAATTTYLCGFSIRANATAAATGNATVTGVITGTMNFTQWTAPNASGVGVTEEVFVPCIPASAANTSIAVVSAAPGTGGVVSVSAWGYQQ